MSDRVFPIATRTSPLAMAQANMVQALLVEAHGGDGAMRFPIMGMQTTGDRITDRALLAAGGKGLFTKELERALLDGKAALAVHSMKDVPTKLPDGLEIVCVLEREDPRDLLITTKGAVQLEDLPEGARLGTASLRRQAQAHQKRPDLQISLLRGNVQTRLGKLKAGEVDATFLAIAGLKRLGHELGQQTPLPITSLLPAPAQGAIGIEIASGDDEMRALLAALNHAPTEMRITAERAVLEALDGSCRTPIAAHAELENGQLSLRAEALSPDGTQVWAAKDSLSSPDLASAREMGLTLGQAIRQQGGAELEAIIAESHDPA